MWFQAKGALIAVNTDRIVNHCRLYFAIAYLEITAICSSVFVLYAQVHSPGFLVTPLERRAKRKSSIDDSVLYWVELTVRRGDRRQGEKGGGCRALD